MSNLMKINRACDTCSCGAKNRVHDPGPPRTIIHETIGCVGVERKPTLAYKFSTANKSASTINLRTEDDWEGLVTDVLAKMKTKKDIGINISVLPENYMVSLRAKNKKKAPVTKTGKGKGKLTVMDLDHNESAGEDDDDEDVEAGEKKALSELDAEYRKCIRCGPSVMCKIDRGGNHVSLSFPQRRAWAVSLACGTKGVTKTTPPDAGALFISVLPSDAPCRLRYARLPNARIYAHARWSSSYASPVMSSDPPDDADAYPLIVDFIETLIAKVPQRQSLREAGQNLRALAYYGIDEITTLTVDEFGTDKFGNILRGDAEYLLRQVKKELNMYIYIWEVKSQMRKLIECSVRLQIPRVTEPAARGLSCDLIQGIVQVNIRCSLVITLSDPPKFLSIASDIVLDPRKTLFNWVEVRRVRWEVEKLDTSIFMVSHWTAARVNNELGITHLLNLVDMVNSAVVKDQNTAWGRIGIHDFEQTLQPLNKLFTIVAANFDMRVNEAVNGYCGKK
ncbi:hypothetical protein B0H13DRAFT_2399012 [Mycena leptocephala]|nr:hypothetical protein B0H13DRAFT_2399012 [Mycena leptocephala]